MGEVPRRSNVVLVDLDGIDVLKTGFYEWLLLVAGCSKNEEMSLRLF
jgi:hypothetical protein